MGAVSPEKKLQDEATVAYFKSQGWQAFAVGGTRWSADVIAVKDRKLAVVEVKSSKDTSAWEIYDDTKDLSPRMSPSIAAQLKTNRQSVYALFPGRPVERCYAITVAAQLLRYFHEFEDRITTYEKYAGSVTLRDAQITKMPYLAVPLERSNALGVALGVLKSKNFISSFDIREASPLAVAEIIYS